MRANGGRGVPTKQQLERGDPTKQQLEDSMRAGFCYWCGRTRTAQGKLIQSWGGHWAMSHGFDLQAIRDILEVPKDYGLVSPDLHRELQRVHRAKHERNPELILVRMKAARVNQKPITMSKYGLKVQREKMRALHATFDGTGLYGAAQKVDSVCAVCRRSYWQKAKYPGKRTAKTCSRRCASVLMSRVRGAGLCWRDARWIRKAWAARIGTQGEIGARFGISNSMVSHITLGLGWKGSSPGATA